MRNRKWTWRLAAGLSLLWVLAMYFLTESSEAFRLFLLAGVLPVVTGWVIYWIVAGFRADRQRHTHSSRIFSRRRK